MKIFLAKGLLILAIGTVAAVSAYAAIDTQQAESATVVTQQSIDNLPMAPKPTDAKQSVATPQSTPEESLTATADTLPVQVAAVNGDYHKYEALNWQNRGYSGGVKDLSIHYTSGDDVTIDADGGGIIGNGDYKSAYSIKKKDVGYVNFDFKQFRKYYDTYGGIWQGHTNSLNRDLYLDIGHIGFEAGITRPDLPNVSVYYDHDYQEGSKSMVNWASDAGLGGGMKIAPAWKEIDQTIDTFGIKGDYTEKGYHFTGDQRWDISRWKTHRYESQIGDGSATASDYYARRGDYSDETDLMTTTFGVDKWCFSDKVFAAGAYRLEHLKNSDLQARILLNKDGTSISTAGSSSSNEYPGGSATNNQDVNSWVLNLMISPWSWLSGTGGFKAELSQRDASSYYPVDKSVTPDVITGVGYDATNSNTYKFSESAGLRFKALPRTAVYSDLSFEQSENHLMINSWGNSDQTRDGIVDEPSITWVTGVDVQPFRFINLTSQFRLREKDQDFNDRVRIPLVNGQVFLEKLHTRTAGFTQRATVHLSSWASTSFRYLLDDTDYITRQLYENVDEKANMLSNTFIYDLSVYPIDNLSVTGSFSQLYSQVKTIAASFGTYLQPFTSNSSTWMIATDYQLNKKVHLDSSIFYTLANNYGNDQTLSAINYAAAFTQLGVTVGCKWDIRKDLAIKPQYAYQSYLPNQDSGVGAAYNAQIVSVSLVAKWG